MNSLQAAIDLVATGQPAFCLHQAWGIGVIRSYDEATKRLVIDFPEQNKKGHAMDAAFFLGKIEFINPNGLVAKAYADATKAEIANLVANDPAGVVKALLAEYPTGECTSYALEANLDRVHFASLASGKDRAATFKAWWTKGRAAVRKDRAILVPERKGGLYALLEAPKDLGEDLFAQYESAPNFERKLMLLEELAGAAAAETRSAANAANLDKVSADLLKEIKKLETARKRDNLPAILGGIWNRDKFFRSAVENVETVSPTASEIIALCTESDLAFVALNIPHTTEKIRSLRTDKFIYIRNYHPERPHLQPCAYKDGKQIVQQLRTLHAAGKLSQLSEKLLFSPTRPREELYELSADRWQVRNLAEDPAYAAVLTEHRQRLDAKLVATKDPAPESMAMYDSDMKPYVGKGSPVIEGNIAQMKKWASEGK